MKDYLIEKITYILDSLPPEWIVMIISCFPILELRGAIPVAVSAYDMPFWKAYTLGVIGNMIPVMPLLLLFQPVSNFLMKYRWYAKMYDWLYNRTMRKSKSVERYGALGLILFTAIPLPTTGAWTACMAASIFRVRISYAFWAIFVGVLIAGLIMGGFSFSIFGS